MRLPGLMAAAYQHETSRAEDPHLHTHVLVPNRQPRRRRAGGDRFPVRCGMRPARPVIYQATLRRRVWEAGRSGMGRPSTGIRGWPRSPGSDRSVLAAASQRSTVASVGLQHLAVGESVSASAVGQCAKATRPKKPGTGPGAVRQVDEPVRGIGHRSSRRSQWRGRRGWSPRVRLRAGGGAAVGGIARSAFTPGRSGRALGRGCR